MKKTVEQWANEYTRITGLPVSVNALRKRRLIAQVGEWVPPSKYLLTEDEFYIAMNTPLPFCKSVGTEWPRVGLSKDA